MNSIMVIMIKRYVIIGKYIIINKFGYIKMV